MHILFCKQNKSCVFILTHVYKCLQDSLDKSKLLSTSTSGERKWKQTFAYASSLYDLSKICDMLS